MHSSVTESFAPWILNSPPAQTRGSPANSRPYLPQNRQLWFGAGRHLCLGGPLARAELGAIVDNVAKVSEVATPDVPATSHPIPLSNVFRDDVPGVTLTTEEALAGAPEHDGSRFIVSAILGEEQ